MGLVFDNQIQAPGAFLFEKSALETQGVYDLELGKEFFEVSEEVDFGNIGPDLSRNAPFEEGIVSKVYGTVEDFPTVGPGLQAVYLQVRSFGVEGGLSGAAENISSGVIVASSVEVGVGVI